MHPPLNALELCRACGWRDVQMLVDTYYHADQKRLATKLAKLDYGENLRVAG